MSATSQPTHNLRHLAQLARTSFELFPSLVLLMLFKLFLWIPGGGGGGIAERTWPGNCWVIPAESSTQFGGRSYCLSTIVDIPSHETCSYDSEALHNDRAQQECMRVAQESSTAPERDLGMGKRWRSYLGHDMSVTTTRLSISRPAPTLPAVDVDLVCHI
ncbi:hypothetical protein B0H14DRAFT_3450599 [Mycena olivaceomarginata]|nr:hypothetical protein B0H14DRAFT_3450599 [Mycena olivaceomarginata]